MIAESLREIWPASCDGKASRSGTVVADQKIDGHRGLLHFSHKLDRSYLTGRTKSSKTGKIVEKGQNIPHIIEGAHYLAEQERLGYTVLDGEIIVPGHPFESVQSVMGAHSKRATTWQFQNEWASFVVFDILFLDGVDLRQRPLYQRDRRMRFLVKKLKIVLDEVEVVERISVQGDEHVKRFYDRVVGSGGEGLVLKDRSGSYGEGWTKMKKVQTFDAVIMGFTEGARKYRGLIGAVQFGAYKDGKLISIGQCSGMPDGNTRWVSSRTNGPCAPNAPDSKIVPIDSLTPQPEGSRLWFSQHREKLLGQVIEVSCNGVTKHGRLRHPQFVRMRPDKAPEDCKAP